MQTLQQYGNTECSVFRSHNRYMNIKIIQETQSSKNGLVSNGIKFMKSFTKIGSLVKKINHSEKRVLQIATKLKGHQFINR